MDFPALTDATGGEDPSCFDQKEAWYPVHYLRDLDRFRPTPFTLLDINLVIWWNDKDWQAFADICPHRLALLSEGRINSQGNLECPYHGWSFNELGQCVDIPQELIEGKAKNSRRACVQTFATAVAQGMLFVYPGKKENARTSRIPIVDCLEENRDKWTIIDTFRDLPYDASTTLENVLDSSHVPFTHHGTIGKRENAAPVDLEVTEYGRNGFKGVWLEGPRRGTLGTQYTTFVAPNLMWHDLTSKQFGRTLTVVYVTPISKGKCRLFARFPFQFNSKIPELFIKLTPRWYSHINQNRILEDDQIFLHYQERFLEKLGGSSRIAKAFYLPTKADRYVLKFHNWITDYSLDIFPQQYLSSPLTKDVLLERYHSHTEHCHSCHRALINLRKIRNVLIFLEILFWLFIIQVNPALIVKVILIFLPLVIWLYLDQLEQKFLKGDKIPSRNLK